MHFYRQNTYLRAKIGQKSELPVYTQEVHFFGQFWPIKVFVGHKNEFAGGHNNKKLTLSSEVMCIRGGGAQERSVEGYFQMTVESKINYFQIIFLREMEDNCNPSPKIAIRTRYGKKIFLNHLKQVYPFDLISKECDTYHKHGGLTRIIKRKGHVTHKNNATYPGHVTYTRHL